MQWQSNCFRGCSCQKTSLLQRKGEWEDNHSTSWNICNLICQIVLLVFAYVMHSFKPKPRCGIVQHTDGWKRWQDLPLLTHHASATERCTVTCVVTQWVAQPHGDASPQTDPCKCQSVSLNPLWNTDCNLKRGPVEWKWGFSCACLWDQSHPCSGLGKFTLLSLHVHSSLDH